MADVTEKFRIKNKTITEVSECLFNVKKFPNSFKDTFEVKDVILPKNFAKGSKVKMTLKKFGFSVPCEYEVTEVSATQVSYRQSSGLMKKWEHTMTLVEQGEKVEIIDTIKYEVPYGLLGHLANDLLLRTEVPSMLYSRLKSLKLK